MATRKYTVRLGFVVVLSMLKANGEKYERTYDGGEEVALDADQAALHAHRIEFANPKDREAALAAEQEAAIAAKATASPVDLVQALTAALSQAMQANAPPSTPAVV